MSFLNRFGVKLIRNMLLISLVPLAITIFMAYNVSKDVIEEDVYTINLTTIEGYKNSINERLKGATSTLDAVAASTIIDSMDPLEMDNLLMEIVDASAVISQIYVMDSSGMQIYKTSGELGDRADREYFKTAIAGDSNFSNVIISASTGEPIIVYAQPILSNNKIVGVLGASIDLSFIRQMIESDRYEEGVYAYIVDKEGVVIAHPDQQMVDDQVNLSDLKPVQEATAGITGYSQYTYDDEEKLASYTYLEFAQWGLIYQEPSHVSFKSVNTMVTVFLGIFVLTAIVVSVVAYFLSRSISRPVELLTKQMHDAGEGRLNLQMDDKILKRKDEFGSLANNFMLMISSLNSLLTEAVDLTEKVTLASNKLASTSDQTKLLSSEINYAVEEIAKGAADQASESEKGVNIVSGFNKAFIELTSRSNATNEKVTEIKNLYEDSAIKMTALDDASSKNIDTVAEFEQSIKDLDIKSKSISNILETISAIAGQTNLLALNASIEAARAGEHGKGFAVVAEEIRKLAEGSKESVDQIDEIVNGIQEEISRTVTSMEELNKTTKFQSQSVEGVNKAFEEIHESVKSISLSIIEIGTSVELLNKDNTQVVDAMSNISAVTEETAASAQEVTASVSEQLNAVEEVAKEAAHLQELSDTLKIEIEKFEL